MLSIIMIARGLLVVFFSMLSFVSCSTRIDGQILANELQKVADAVGMTYMQNEYDQMAYEEKAVSGHATAVKLAQSLSTKFERMENALKNINLAIGSKYADFQTTSSMQECCRESGLTFNSRFNAMVSLDRACVAISGSAGSDRKIPTQEIVEAMKSNLNNDPTLLWQYFGSDQGVLTNYPASNLSNCQTLDARFRNYYVATASPVPKDVVIMFEASSAMTQKSFENSDPSTPDKPLIQLAKESSTTVLNTLGSLDRVGVIAFNGDVTTPLSQDGCYRQTLAKATRNNINKLKGFINNKGVNGDSDYNKAFAAAFQFFNESERSLQGEKRDRIILFLTSGSSYSGNPLEIIRDGNAAMNNEVVIHVFQLGKDRPQETEELLRNISRQVLSPGSTRTGRYMVLSDQKMLMTAMGEYYQYSENERQEDPVFSEPFIDMFSQKGLLISMCLPVYTVGGFKGVVCNDFRLEELLADVTYLREGENSYAFVIDGFGRTLVHPLLPQRRQSTDNPDIVDIENFERLVGKDVIQSMKRGETGNKTGIVTKMPISRGIMLYEGDTSKTIKANYFWTKVQKSNYSVCVVIKEDLSSLKELKDATIDSKGFYYHTREITDYGSQPCRHYARWATKDHSCVMLAPSSFADPTGYLIRNETQAKIREYERYLRGESTNNPGFVDTLLNSVAATYKLESFWKDSISHDQAKYVVWRYICTKDGITRLYPCVQLTKDYDPALRPWYQRTIAKRKKFVLSTPYLDAWGSGYLLTLSRSMYEGKLNGQHSPDDVVVGVMGTDLTVNYFNQLIQEIYPVCGQAQSYSCIVIDDSGFIVMHPDFVVTGSDPGLDNLFHIGNKEGTIARDLISQGIMYREPCLDTEYRKDQFTYRITYTLQNSAGLDRMDEAGYEIRPVPDSVISVILKRKSTSSSACCSDYKKSPSVNKCGSDNCDCLCYRDVDFNVCTNKYVQTARSPPCSARPQPLLSVSPNETTKTDKLQNCFPFDCPQKMSKRSCFGVAGCSWCEETMTETFFDNPFCTDKIHCPFGRCLKENCASGVSENKSPNKHGDDDESDSINLVGLVLGVILGVVLIVLVVVVICIVIKRRNGNSYNDSGSADGYLDVVNVPARNQDNIITSTKGSYDSDSPPPSYDGVHDCSFGYEGPALHCSNDPVRYVSGSQ